jgi:hypothetical protein
MSQQDPIQQLKELVEKRARGRTPSVLTFDFDETTGTENAHRWTCTYYLEGQFLSQSMSDREFTKKKDAQRNAAEEGLRRLTTRSRM